MANAGPHLRRPGSTEWLAAIPADGRRPDTVKNSPARFSHVRHLDHSAGVAFVPEVNKAAPRAVALLVE